MSELVMQHSGSESTYSTKQILNLRTSTLKVVLLKDTNDQ